LQAIEASNLKSKMLKTFVVRIDPRYFLRTELDLLFGNHTIALTELAWKSKCYLPILVSEIMQSDVNLFKKDLDLQKRGHVVFQQEE
jgi:GDPmannose 4,6-dehydratase